MLFRQQQKLFQQARAAQSGKLKSIKELYEQFIKVIISLFIKVSRAQHYCVCVCVNIMCVCVCAVQNMEEMEKSHEMFLQGAQQELKKEMATLQKKILMDTVSWDRT